MSHHKLFKNRNDGSSSVYVSMKNLEANVEQNGDSVIIIDNQVHTTNSQNKPVSIHIYLLVVPFLFLLF